MKSLASSASFEVGPDDLAAEAGEQRRRPVADGRVVGADDLGQRAELLERVALGDPLRAEGDVDAAAAVGEAPARRRRSCPGRPCCAGRRARRRGGAARSARRSSRRASSTGPRNSSTGVPMTTTSASARPTIAGSADSSRRPVGRTSRSSSSAPVSRNGISPRPIRSSVAAFVSKIADPQAARRRRRGSAAGRRGRRRRGRRRRGHGSLMVGERTSRPGCSTSPEGPRRATAGA